MAAQLLYELNGNVEISFIIDSNPVPITQPDGFIVEDVAVTVDGITTTRDVGFARALSDGGLIILNTGFNLAGPQLFSGTFDAPQLLTGTFDLVGFDDPDNPDLQFSLSVVDVDALAVPEPSTWAMLLLGFALLAAFLRRRPRVGQAEAPATLA